MNIVLIGETCIDVYFYGTCDRLSPEAPVPVFVPTNEERRFGMVSNVMDNLFAILGGIDPKKKHQVSVISPNTCPVKTRYIEDKSNHLLLRVDQNDSVDEFRLDRLPKNDLDAIINADCILISDYCKGFLTHEDYYAIRQKTKDTCMIYVDTKRILTHDIVESVDFIKLNLTEYAAQRENQDSRSLVNDYDSRIIVTMGMLGAKWSGWNFPVEKQVRTTDVSGAGDTFFAAFAAYHLLFKDVKEGIEFANKCAMNVVSKRGVTTPDLSWYRQNNGL
jgi:D-beta-D-heptose 7-phosphate kinase/D-beta-D-heptose 1-phosphate adenosyltransferase